MTVSTWRRCGAAAAVVASVAFAPAAFAEAPRVLARAAATETTAFDIYLPPQHPQQLETLVAAQADPQSPQYHKWLTPGQFATRFGASPEHVAKIEAELQANGFHIESRSSLGLHVVGSVGLVERAFGVQLSHAVFADGTPEVVADRPLALLPSLEAAGAHVAQYTTVPPKHRPMLKAGPVPLNFRSTVGPYYTDDLRQAYDYPSFTSLNGNGVTIGILMNGDWNETGLDMQDYFTAELASTHVPNITTVNIGGGAPFDVNNSAETHLDIQQSSGIALGATEVLFNLPDLSEAQIIAGLTTIDEDNATDVVNMSFGGSEVAYLAVNNGGRDMTWLLQIEHTLFLQGNSQGITFVASSGDHGAVPVTTTCNATTGTCKTAPTLTVECPACDPNVTAVGGTNLVTTFTKGSNNSAYVSENATDDPMTTAGEVWGSGGGISVVWTKPAWQKTAVAGFTTPGAGRTVPDLALHMGGCQAGFSGFKTPCGANRSSDWLWIGGTAEPVIGTSASSPDIVGLFALMVNMNGGSPKGRLGNMNPYIYGVAKSNGANAFHHANIVGKNGGPSAKYTVKPPYDLVIGNGTLDARQFMKATAMPASGIPGTASNP